MNNKPDFMEVLKIAKELILNNRWVQKTGSVDKDDNPVDIGSENACGWCFMGAIWTAEEKLVPNSYSGDKWTEDENKLLRVIGFDGWCEMFDWNDVSERTKEEVLAKYDDAIEAFREIKAFRERAGSLSKCTK